MRCTYHCRSSSFDLMNLVPLLNDKNLDCRFFDKVLFIQIAPEEDIFVFPYGTIVSWNVSTKKLQEIFLICDAVSKGILDVPVSDACHFRYSDKTHVLEEEDMIELESSDLLIRLSLSHGLAQSVKLDTFEDSISKTIEKARPLVQQICDAGKTSLSRKKLSKLIGHLFKERNFINLDCDLLDTPEFFWRRPSYEPYYHKAAEYMDIDARLDTLNKRLDIVHELYDFLSNELNHSHSSFLEWIIILLIVSEVVLTISKDILKLI